MKELQLDLEIVKIKDVQFGEGTGVQEGVLTICKEEMLEYLSDPVFTRMEIELARPGESVRIIPVKDVIEPRIKTEGGEGSFPGFFGGFSGVGEGKTKVLRGCAVVTAGKIVGFQEGFIDMRGPGAAYTPFSVLNNVVLVADVVDGVTKPKHEEIMRVLGLKAAYYLAEKAKDAPVDEVESYCLKEPERKGLPKVGIIYMFMAQGLLHDNYLNGVDSKTLYPTLIHPNEAFDSALVNGVCVAACDKNTTWDHQNNGLIQELYRRHGVDLDFRGVIITPTYPTLANKLRCSHAAVRIARTLGLDGVFIPIEGGGNPEADTMEMVRQCEHHGIKTVCMVTAQGDEEPLADTTPEADAVVNSGNSYCGIKVPAMDRVIGYPEQIAVLSGASQHSLQPDGSMDLTIVAIMSSMNRFGHSYLSSKIV